MKLYKPVFAIIALSTVSLPTSVTAQTSAPGSGYLNTEARALVGFTIPLGPRVTASDPRLELTFQHRRRTEHLQIFMRRSDQHYVDHEFRFGVSMAESPDITLNGRQLMGEADQTNLSDTGAVLLGAGIATLGLMIWVTAETTDEVGDLISPD